MPLPAQKWDTQADGASREQTVHVCLLSRVWLFVTPMDSSPPGSSVHGISQARILAAATAKSLQSCPTTCEPIDSNPPGSPVPGILQTRTLEWVAISFSNAWKWKVKVKSLSRVWLFKTPWTVAHQAPLSMGFSRQEYWSGLPFPPPGDLLDPEIEPRSPVSHALVGSLPPWHLGSPISNSKVTKFNFVLLRRARQPFPAQSGKPPPYCSPNTVRPSVTRRWTEQSQAALPQGHEGQGQQLQAQSQSH